MGILDSQFWGCFSTKLEKYTLFWDWEGAIIRPKFSLGKSLLVNAKKIQTDIIKPKKKQKQKTNKQKKKKKQFFYTKIQNENMNENVLMRIIELMRLI